MARRKITTAFIAFIFFASCSGVPRVKSERQGLLDRWASDEISKMDASKLSRRLDTTDIDQIPTDRVPAGAWIWPVQNLKVNSKFGKRRRGFHEGVDLKAQPGTPIYAAQSGEVIYADSKIGGYGNMLVVKHAAGLFSVYAHLSDFKVREGTKVRQGQLIGLSGKSGRVRGPHLHFEVRRGSIALNPESFYKRSEFFSIPNGRSVASDDTPSPTAKQTSKKHKGRKIL